MSIEVFTEWKCSKCKKVHREAGDCENSLPAGWAEGTIKVYGKDGQIKQLVYPDLCPACARATLKEWDVPRKRTRKAKAVTIEEMSGSIDFGSTAEVPVPPIETKTATEGLSTTSQKDVVEPPKKRGRPRKRELPMVGQQVTSHGPSVPAMFVGITDKLVRVDAPADCPWADGPHKHTEGGICLAPKEQQKYPKDVAQTLPCPHADPTPHVHVQEGDLILCRYPKPEVAP